MPQIDQLRPFVISAARGSSLISFAVTAKSQQMVFFLEIDPC